MGQDQAPEAVTKTLELRNTLGPLGRLLSRIAGEVGLLRTRAASESELGTSLVIPRGAANPSGSHQG